VGGAAPPPGCLLDPAVCPRLLTADRQEPGFGDVARKVAADFRRAGLIACGREVRRQIMVAQNAAMRSLLSPA
jgi:hypothetical protein